MLPSLSAGTFECGRPQIVFERGRSEIVIEAKILRLTVSSGCVSGSRAAALFAHARQIFSAQRAPAVKISDAGKHRKRGLEELKRRANSRKS